MLSNEDEYSWKTSYGYMWPIAKDRARSIVRVALMILVVSLNSTNRNIVALWWSVAGSAVQSTSLYVKDQVFMKVMTFSCLSILYEMWCFV